MASSHCQRAALHPQVRQALSEGASATCWPVLCKAWLAFVHICFVLILKVSRSISGRVSSLYVT